MARFSWGDAERRRADTAQQSTSAEALQQQLRDRMERERQEITNQIVAPFLQAMAAAGNPGSQRHRSQRRVRSWEGRTDRATYTVSTDGSWTCTMSRSIGYLEEAYHTCESTPRGSLDTPEVVGQALQDALLQLLIQHRVPIPRS